MLEILVAVGPLFFLLVFSELLWRARVLRGEPARKCLHIIIGSYVAVWPYFMSFGYIQLISLAMLAGVLISHKYHIFHAINDVKRQTWGDILYAIGLFVAASLASEPWIFAIAVLHMSVADGLAGLIGSHYGKGNQYKILGSNKSIAGTFSFIAASFTLMMLFAASRPGDISLALIIIIPFMASAIENIGFRGTDNVLIPLLVIAMLGMAA